MQLNLQFELQNQWHMNIDYIDNKTLLSSQFIFLSDVYTYLYKRWVTTIKYIILTTFQAESIELIGNFVRKFMNFKIKNTQGNRKI